jgi:hypothetical protein
MANLPPEVKKYVARLKADVKATVAKYEAAADVFRFAYALTANKALLPDSYKASVAEWMDGDKVKMRIWVKSFRDMLPILEAIERAADLGVKGYAFTKTLDYPAYSERVYISDKLMVEATLEGSGDNNCKRIITGYEPVEPRPIYAFDCGNGAEQIPDHPELLEEQPIAVDAVPE